MADNEVKIESKDVTAEVSIANLPLELDEVDSIYSNMEPRLAA